MRKHSLLIGNWITFSIVYFMMIFNKFGQLRPSTLYLYLYFLILVYNSVSSIYYHKYQTVLQKSFWLTLRIIFWSNFISALFIIITVSFTQLWTISREFIFITLIILFLLEIFISAIIFKYTHKTTRLIGEFTKDKNHLVYRYNIKWLITGATTLIAVYGILLFFQTKQLAMDVQDEQNLLLLIGAWGISTLLTNRFKYPNSVNHYYEIAPYIKASIIGILFIILFYFSLRLNTQDVTIIFMSGLIHSSIEIFSFYLYFFGVQTLSLCVLIDSFITNLMHVGRCAHVYELRKERKYVNSGVCLCAHAAAFSPEPTRKQRKRRPHIDRSTSLSGASCCLLWLL